MRFRLAPTLAQEAALLEHCAHARFVQQQALRDFAQAMRSFFAGTNRRPTWRKAGVHEGFRIVGRRGGQWDVRRLSRKVGEVRAGRWHVTFAVIPPPVTGPGTGEVVGVDRGVAVSAALSSGALLSVPGLGASEAERLRRGLARAQRGSNRRKRLKVAIGRLTVRQSDRRKDWVEKVSTDLATRFDLIRVENLKIKNMVRSARGTIAAPGRNVRAEAGLNRSIHAAGWGSLVKRLEDKAAGRVERIDPAFTSQTCNACGHRAADNRESQAVFRCRACGHTDHADLNAAKNIAAGRAVKARGALQPLGGAVNREPQPVLTSV